MKSIVLCLAVLALAGCRYESAADLRSSAKVYHPTAAFAAGEHMLQSEGRDSLLVLSVARSAAEAVVLSDTTGGDKATLVALLSSDALPDRTFVAMAESESAAGQPRYHYYAFSFGPDHLVWYSPSMPVEVSDFDDIARDLAVQQTRGKTTYNMVPAEYRQAVMDHFVARRAAAAAEKQAQPQPQPQAAPQVQAQPTVNGLAVGDGVHVSGLFSDQPSIIREIDEPGRRVKVQRMSDGISEWVSFDRIISREESTANNVARTGIIIGGMVCLLSPETCQPDPK